MVDIQSVAAEIRRGKKEEEEDRNYRAKIECPPPPITQGGHKERSR